MANYSDRVEEIFSSIKGKRNRLNEEFVLVFDEALDSYILGKPRKEVKK